MNKHERIAIRNIKKDAAELNKHIDPYLPIICHEQLRHVSRKMMETYRIYVVPFNRHLTDKGLSNLIYSDKEILSKALSDYDSMKVLNLHSFRSILPKTISCRKELGNLKLILTDDLKIDPTHAELLNQTIDSSNLSTLTSTVLILIKCTAHLIIYTQKIEQRMLSMNPQPSYQYINRHLNELVDEIMCCNSSLTETEPVLELLKQKIQQKIKLSVAGSKSKENKQPLFNGFITWALSLSDPGRYRWPIEGARDYCQQLREQQPDNLGRLISEKTPRTMCEKLAKHCEKNSIKNPLTR